MRFKLIAGSHVDERGVIHREGSVVDSDIDLAARFNGKIEVVETDKDDPRRRIRRWIEDEHARKFERLADDAPVAGGFVFDPGRESLEDFAARVKAKREQEDLYDAMTDAELHEVADRAGVYRKGIDRPVLIRRLRGQDDG
jgi:hypothetical protein